MFTSVWIAALVAVFIWWFSTGAILMFVRRADSSDTRAHLRLTLQTAPLFLVGWVLHWLRVGSTEIWAAYAGFLSVIGIWGWLELAFLCGIVTGPNLSECPKGVPEPERFLRAWGTLAHSEIALFLSLLILYGSSEGAPNQTALWTFAVLFFARVSAKLNLYFGVPNINTEFLPRPMRHLASHFRIARMNAFFPIGVTALTFAFVCWLERGFATPAGTQDSIKFALLAALTGLAVLEHWAMVLPLQEARLWKWATASANAAAAPEPTALKTNGKDLT